MPFKKALLLNLDDISDEKFHTEIENLNIRIQKKIVINILHDLDIYTVGELLSYDKDLSLIHRINNGILKHLEFALSEHLGFEVVFTKE